MSRQKAEEIIIDFGGMVEDHDYITYTGDPYAEVKEAIMYLLIHGYLLSSNSTFYATLFDQSPGTEPINL